jgi:hypothetical protein
MEPETFSCIMFVAQEKRKSDRCPGLAYFMAQQKWSSKTK